MGGNPRVELHPEMPTGPLNRVADNTLGEKLLDWKPKVQFLDGLHRTIKWYVSSRSPKQAAEALEQLLIER